MTEPPPTVLVVPSVPTVPVVPVAPIVTTQSVLMVDNNTYKTITTTNGVPYPVVTSTTYPVSYGVSEYDTQCYPIVHYSDNTHFISITEAVRTTGPTKSPLTGFARRQFSFAGASAGVTEIDIYNQPQTIFPYVLLNKALPVVTYTTGQTQTQTWSDGRTYSKLM